MSKKSVIIWVVILAIIAGALFYFRNDIATNINSLQNSAVGMTLENIGNNLSLPAPLEELSPFKPVNLSAETVLQLTNQQRAENGNLPALTENAILEKAALAKANDMFKNQYFEHVSPSGVDPGQLIQSYGYQYAFAGENLILGNFSSEQEAVQDWMNSPGHRANILNVHYTQIGVAFVKGTYQGQTVWIGVQEFGEPLANCPQPSSTLANQIATDKETLSQESADLQQKQAALQQENHYSEQYQTDVNNYNQEVDQYNALVATVRQEVATYNSQVNTFNACIGQ